MRPQLTSALRRAWIFSTPIQLNILDELFTNVTIQIASERIIPGMVSIKSEYYMSATPLKTSVTNYSLVIR